jgi:hypothetical protein
VKSTVTGSGVSIARGEKLAQRVEINVVAAFHVHQAGAIADVALAAEGQRGQRAQGMHGIHVAQQQNAALSRARVRHRRADTVAQPHAAGDPLCPRSQGGEVVLGQVHHAVDRGGVESRAFGLDPGPQSGQHLVGVEGKVDWVMS